MNIVKSLNDISACYDDNKSLKKRHFFFNELLSKFHTADLLYSDPIYFVRQYSKPLDQEVVGFLCASFSYGSVNQIQHAIKQVLLPMQSHPYEFIKNYDGKNYWPHFYYRFHKSTHLQVLLKVLQLALTEYGSLGELFKQKARQHTTQNLCVQILSDVSRYFCKQVEDVLKKEKTKELWRGLRFFFNSPENGSACKKLLMYLRWMVRKDHIDLGLWPWISTSQLIIPTDTHVARLAYYLNLRKGKEESAPNWKMAIEITESLKKINPEDPVCYDFALTRLGILNICKRKYINSICNKCPVEGMCRFSSELGNHARTN